MLETLEPRAMLSVTTYSSDTYSGYTIAVTDQADDLFVQRRADGQLLFADNSSFTGAQTTGAPNTLYVSNGFQETLPGPMYRGDNRSVAQGGTGYRSDANFSNRTLFTFNRISTGSGSVSSVAGRLTYNGAVWDFDTNAPLGAQFTLVSGSPTAVPQSVGIANNGLVVGSTIIWGATIAIDWSVPVPTTPTNTGLAPPQVTYAYQDGTQVNSSVLTRVPLSPAYNSTAGYSFDSGPGGIIDGTFTGNLYFPDYTITNTVTAGTATSLRFVTDLVTGGTLRFDNDGDGTFDETFGDYRQYRVRGSFSSSGGLSLSFTNALSDGGTTPTYPSGSAPLTPPAVVASIDPFLVYEQDPDPSTFTLFAGFNLPSQLWVDLLTPGSTINIDSPVVVATPSVAAADRPDIELSATTINISAQVSSQDSFLVHPSAAGTAIAERLNVNASVAIPSQTRITLDNDPSNDVPGENAPGGPNRGQLFVSPSGSLSGALANTPAQVTTPTSLVIIEANQSDIVLEGALYGTSQSIYMRSPAAVADLSPFYMTTKSLETGANTGVLQGDTVSVTLSNDAPTPQDGSIAYNVVDLNTDVNSFRIRASSQQTGNPPAPSPSGPFPYVLTINERNNVSFDAVAASSLPITLTAGGSVTFTSALETAGDVNILAGSNSANANFVISAPISTTFGRIRLVADSLAINNSLSVLTPTVDDRVDDITLVALGGDIQLAGVVSAVNNINISQQNSAAGSGRVFGSAEVRADRLQITAEGEIGNASVSQDNPQFFLRTDVRELIAQAGTGVAILEANDITIPSLRSASGQVSLQANGFDPVALGGVAGVGSNSVALLAYMTDVTNLFVSAPNGSVDVTVDTARSLALGSVAALRDLQTDADAIEPMRAAGNVRIRSQAGPIVVRDAPVAGGDALRARVATTADLAGTYTPGDGVITPSSLVAPANGILPAIDGVQLRFGDTVLLKNQASTEQNGLYQVKSVGSAVSPWRLVRAPNADTASELPTNSLVRVDQGSTLGQTVYQLNVGAGTFGSVPIVATAVTLTTNIGSQLTSRTVTFQVSSDGGTNSSAGSLGKMLTLRQVNDTSSSVLNPEQEMAFVVQGLPGPIRLTQELPAIHEAFKIVGNGTVVDGSRIDLSAEGNTVTAGEEVNGFEFTAGSGAVGLEAGGSLTRFTVGGFAQGAAVKIDGAAGILLDTLVVGRSETGDRLANKYGIQVTGAGGSATVFNSVVVSSNETGILAEGAASPVTIVGTTVGSTSQNNIEGIRLANTGSVVIPPTLPASTVAGDFDGNGQIDYAYRDAAGIWQVVRTLANGTTAAAEIWGHWSAGISWNDIVVGDFNGDGRDDIAGRSGNGAWWIAESTGGRFANKWAGVWSHLAGWQSVLVGDFNGDGLDDIIGRSSKNAWWGGITTTASGNAQFQNRLMGIWSIAVTWSDGVVGDFNGDGLDDIASAANGATWWIGQSTGSGITAVRHGSSSPASSTSTVGAEVGNRIGIAAIDSIRYEGTTTQDSTLLAIPADVPLSSLFVGQGVAGDGLSGGSRIVAIDRASRTVSLSVPMIASGATTLTFAAGARNVVQDNRSGITLSAGATAVTNTTVANNTLNGITILGGDYTIGLSTERSLESNAIYRNGRWGIDFASAYAPSNPQQDGRRIQGNYLGVTVNGTVAQPNTLGNVAEDGVAAPASLGFTPDPTTGVDSFGNQHSIGSGGGGGGGGEGGGGSRPNPPPVV